MDAAYSSRGFSLIEALIAAALMASALVALAHVVALGHAQAASARQTIAAMVLAQSKLEELRSAAWRFDAAGARISDPLLVLSPANALVQDVGGWVEMLDRFGAPAGAGRPAHYRRRWAITALDPPAGDTLALQVCVAIDGGSDSAGACVGAVRARKP